jgi:RimJ/RimL family protein N-acetyltransferase
MIKIEHLSEACNYQDITNEACPSFSGIIAGECAGQIWVDDVAQPRIALAYSPAVGGFAFFGQLDTEEEYRSLTTSFNDTMISYLTENDYECFEFSIESDSLKPYLLRLFEDKSVQIEKEFSFRRNDVIMQTYSLPKGFLMQRVDAQLWEKLRKGSYQNAALLKDRLLESWGSLGRFEEKSLAYCITDADRIAAVIIGTASFHDIIPIDIEVEEEFRNQGFGYFLTIEFVNECMYRGLAPQWDCVESNPASKRLAEKAGFRLFRENEVYWFGL